MPFRYDTEMAEPGGGGDGPGQPYAECPWGRARWGPIMEGWLSADGFTYLPTYLLLWLPGKKKKRS